MLLKVNLQPGLRSKAPLAHPPVPATQRAPQHGGVPPGGGHFDLPETDVWPQAHVHSNSNVASLTASFSLMLLFDVSSLAVAVCYHLTLDQVLWRGLSLAETRENHIYSFILRASPSSLELSS